MGTSVRLATLLLALSARVLAAPDAGPAAPAAEAQSPKPATPATSTATATPHPTEPAPATPALAPPLSPNAAPNTQAPAPGAAEAVSLAGANVDAIHTPSSPEAWGGVQTPGAPELSQRVASYDLHATLDPVKHTVEGRETLRWTNRSAVPVQTIYFHLYLNGFEGPGSTWMTEKGSGGFRSGVDTKKGEWGFIDVLEIAQAGQPATLSFVHPDGGPETDRSVLRADLTAPVPPGATVSLDIRFHDQLPRVIARTGWFDSYHLVAQWFPKIGVLELPGERGATAPRWNVHEFHMNSEFYADFGSYDLEVTAPKGFTVAASGERVGEPAEQGANVIHKFHQDDVHDAVFAAWDKFVAPLKGTYQGPGSPTVTVETYYPAEFAQSAADSQQGTLDSLKYFSDTLGPYPYRHVTVIVPPHNAGESGGMEYETFFTSDGSNGLLSGFSRFVAVHEFGHGYFMGLLATNEFEEPFLDEGMNELWDDRMLQDESIPIRLGLLDKLGFSLPRFGYWDMERIGRGPGPFIPDPVVASSWKRYSNNSYGSIYPRTAILFHDLENALGGDTFARGMKLYYQRWHHRHPSTADLLQALSDACEKSEDRALVERWFDTQIYSAAPVDDAVVAVEAEEMKPEPGTMMVDGGRVELDEESADKEISEARKAFKEARADAGTSDKDKDAKSDNPDAGTHKKFEPGAFPYRSIVRAQRRGTQLAQTLLVKFEDGSSQTISWPPGESWHRWVFEGPARIESAQLDPEQKLLLDLNKLDDGRTRESKKLAARRWALEIGAFVQILFSLLGGL